MTPGLSGRVCQWRVSCTDVQIKFAIKYIVCGEVLTWTECDPRGSPVLSAPARLHAPLLLGGATPTSGSKKKNKMKNR